MFDATELEKSSSPYFKPFCNHNVDARSSDVDKTKHFLQLSRSHVYSYKALVTLIVVGKALSSKLGQRKTAKITREQFVIRAICVL